MQKVDGGDILVRMLLAWGIDTVFTLHGGHLDAIYQAALDHKLRLIDTRHEQAAGHAADGWARTTGRVGVVMVTAGPGVTDVVTAVANAYLDCVPMLVIGGRSPLVDDERLPLQGGFSQVDLMKPITKWSTTVTHLQRLPDFVGQALRTATEGRPGPVFLELPVDVLFSRIESDRVALPAAAPSIATPAPSPDAVNRAIEALSAAQRPLIMAAGGVWFSHGADDLRAFAEATGISVLANGKGRGCMPEDHDLSGGGFATLAVVPPGSGPDVVLLLGARLGLFTGGAQRPFIPAAATVIQADIEAEEIGRNREIDIGIVADCRQTLRALHAAAMDRAWPDRSAWAKTLRGARRAMAPAFASALSATASPVHPYRLAHDVAAFLDREDDVLVADGGETAFWVEMNSTIRRGGHWLSHGYLGCLGTGLPFAIAAQVAHPESRVVCVTGDGSLGLNFAEFDTMARHGLPVVVVVNNDQQWGMSRHGQQLMYGKDRTVVSELGTIRYDQAAAGFGCYGELVEDPAGIAPALERAFAS
jgi:acetolactate synthase-1/2/3 large subunit